jgi:hypothetical protein
MQTALRRGGFAVVLLSLFHPTQACAAAGDGVGFGPVLAFTWPDGASLGWELSGVRGVNILEHFTLGGSYRLIPRSKGLDSSPQTDPAYFHYLAWEPWILVGATLGAALTDQFQPRVAYGIWEGLPISLDGQLFDDDSLQWVFSIAIGWRGIGGTQQFYVAPKIWRMRGFDFFN